MKDFLTLSHITASFGSFPLFSKTSRSYWEKEQGAKEGRIHRQNKRRQNPQFSYEKQKNCLDSGGILLYKWVRYLTLVIHAVRHTDEAAAKFDAGKEFSFPEQIGRGFAKLERSRK